MSKRVAVRNNGDSVEKFAFLAPLATGALAAGKAALATGAGKALVGGLAFGAGKRMASNAFKEQEKESESFTDKVKSRGEKAADAGAAYAQAQQASQQQMEQRGQQMADKAKAGSQITTGEPMDMSWQMLKAWSFTHGFDAFDKETVINHANKRKLKHVRNNDLGHHDVRFSQRYKPDQKMPKGAEKLTPRDLALAYMDLMLQKNPELLNQVNTKMPARDKSKPDNFPGITFPLLETDEPIRSTHEGDNGKMMEAYHPVFAAGHSHHEPSEHPKVGLVTAYDSPTGSTDRTHMPVTHVPNLYSHDFYDIGDDDARQAHYDKADASVGVSQVVRNRNIVAQEAQRRHEGDFMQPVDVERMKTQGLGRSMTPQQAIQRVMSANPLSEPHLNPLIANPQSELREKYQQYLAQQQKQTEMPKIDTPAPTHIGGGMYVWQGKYYGGLGQPSLPPEAAAMIQTGEPMDMAWRMLKSQLPFR